MAIEDILKPEFIWWKDLSESEEEVIKNPKEFPIFSVIYGMPENVRDEIYKSMRIKDEYSDTYRCTEKGWIHFFEERFCEHHCIDINELKKDCPESDKIKNKEASELLSFALDKKFKLYWAAKHRDEMNIIHPNNNTAAFFFQVDYYLGWDSN